MRLVELKFKNRTAGSTSVLLVADGSCAEIALWYGAFHSGDDYVIRIDGRKQKQSINGEIT